MNSGTAVFCAKRVSIICDESAEALASMLQSNNTLTSLDLSRNKIGAEGAKALASMLQSNNTLTTLDLYFNKIGAEGAEALASKLQRNLVIAQDGRWLVVFLCVVFVCCFCVLFLCVLFLCVLFFGCVFCFLFCLAERSYISCLYTYYTTHTHTHTHISIPSKADAFLFSQAPG